MAKLKVNLDVDDVTQPQPEDQKLRQLSSSLPSPHRAKSGSLKYAQRVQFAFSNVPLPIKEAFVKEAASRGITQKELLYDCLRAGGIEVPPLDEIDGRRR